MILTGRPALLARSPACAQITFGYSSLPPKPPPVTAWTTRSFSSGSANDGLERLDHVVGALQRAERHERAVFSHHASRAVRLDVGLLLVRHAVLAFDDDAASAKPAAASPRSIAKLLKTVVGLLGVEKRRLLLVLDADVRERGVGLGADRMRDEQDRLHRMADAVRGEQRLVVLDQRHVVGAGMSSAVTTTYSPHGKDAGSSVSERIRPQAIVERSVAPNRQPGAT